jgi:hypothetical protein
MHGSEWDAYYTRFASHATGDFERARVSKLMLAALPRRGGNRAHAACTGDRGVIQIEVHATELEQFFDTGGRT